MDISISASSVNSVKMRETFLLFYLWTLPWCPGHTSGQLAQQQEQANAQSTHTSHSQNGGNTFVAVFIFGLFHDTPAVHWGNWQNNNKQTLSQLTVRMRGTFCCCFLFGLSHDVTHTLAQPTFHPPCLAVAVALAAGSFSFLFKTYSVDIKKNWTVNEYDNYALKEWIHLLEELDLGPFIDGVTVWTDTLCVNLNCPVSTFWSCTSSANQHQNKINQALDVAPNLTC